jgi:hypothetical protein
MDSRAKITLGVFCWAAIPAGGLLWLVTTIWPEAPGIASNAQIVNEGKGIALVITLGAIGGYVRWMHYLRTIVFDPEKIWQWMLESALTPLMGAALALVFCIAFRAGLTVQTASGGSNSVNWMGIYALAGVVGLFSPDAIERLGLTFQALFANDASRKEFDTVLPDVQSKSKLDLAPEPESGPRE